MASEILVNQPEFTVRRIFVSAMDNAVYLITDRRSGEQILIDAADDSEMIFSLIDDGALDAAVAARLVFIVTTYAHWDHTRATAAVAASTGAAIAIGRADAAQLAVERGVDADLLLDHGELVQIDGVTLEVIGLRGHTPGSVALSLRGAKPGVLFTGDSLFPGGIGNTGGDLLRFEQLFVTYPRGSSIASSTPLKCFPGTVS